jgi:CRISPR-associated protein Csb1
MRDLDQLLAAVAGSAAVRRRRRMQPVGGPGDKLFPPTYPGESNNDPPRHVFERRRLGGADVVCVLLDSVQSQANRLEEALLRAAVNGTIRLPRLEVAFPDELGIEPVSSLTAPHRVFDAILRDSDLEGVHFAKSPLGERLKKARPHDASALLECAPNSLLFGSWNSTSDGGGLGAKFARAITSEIVGVNVPVEEVADRRTGEVSLRTSGRRTGSRIDPLGVIRKVEVYKGESGWDVDQASAGKKSQRVPPSQVNHGNIAPSVAALGVTCDYAVQTAVLSFAGLRRLSFSLHADPARDAAGRAYLAALGLVALTRADGAGHALRSRCDLVGDPDHPLTAFELVGAEGRSTELPLDAEAAVVLYETAFDHAVRHGLALNPEPVRLTPQPKLVHLVRESQRLALAGEGGETDVE